MIRRVLDSTLQEIARVGYQGLRIEDVAARAKVNKTTIYRRWPTKKDLVRTALLKLVDSKFAGFEALPDSGSLRGDMLAAAQYGIRALQMPDSESLLRISMTERADPEVIAIGKSIQAHRRILLRGIFDRAKARGEFSGDLDLMMLILDLLRGALIGKMFLERETPDEEWLKRVVDLLLYGALRETSRKESAR